MHGVPDDDQTQGGASSAFNVTIVGLVFVVIVVLIVFGVVQLLG